MVNAIIIDEIIALEGMRIQKAITLDHSILVMELYSPVYKRLFFVFDTNPETQSLHVQKAKPIGIKSKHPLDLLLQKYGTGKVVKFLYNSPRKL